MKLNILHITPDFNYACGRSYYVNLLCKYQNKQHRVFVITNGGDSIERLEECRIPCTIIKNLKSKNPISIAGNIKKLRKFIAENKIDIIHNHHRLPEMLSIRAILRIKHNKPATVFTSLSIVKRKYNIEYKSDRIIAVSNSIVKMLRDKFNIPQNKISLIHNFTDTDELKKTKMNFSRKGKKRNPFIILAIGRFHKDKDFETLLRALKILKNEQITLLMIGEGKNEINYRRYILKNKLNAEIIEPQKKLLKYFLTADICVLPSSRDPFPNFMLQAGLHRVPFIGANVDGIGELIKDGLNGLLFESGNEIELAKKIMLYKSSNKLAEKCSANLYRDVISNYTQECIIPKIDGLYKQLIQSKKFSTAD